MSDSGCRNATEQSITIEGVGSDERMAIAHALSDCGHDIAKKTDVTLSRLTEENIDDLLGALLDVEQELSEMGCYDEAEAADRIHRQARSAAEEEGLL